MYELKTDQKFQNCEIAIASSCDEPHWANECLKKMRVGPNLDVELGSIFKYSEIYKVNFYHEYQDWFAFFNWISN